MSQIISKIAGTGSYLPKKILSNKDLETMVDTTDEWIFTRTGIRQRHIAAKGEHTSDLALEAAKNAIASAGIDANQIDLIIIATTTPDKIFPSVATMVQHKLGVSGCPAFDIQAVCSGFVYALATANNFIKAGSAKCALVIGAETFSRITDYSDRGNCILLKVISCKNKFFIWIIYLLISKLNNLLVLNKNIIDLLLIDQTHINNFNKIICEFESKLLIKKSHLLNKMYSNYNNNTLNLKDISGICALYSPYLLLNQVDLIKR